MSSRYEGLNLPQLLDLMHELVIPGPVSWTPQTPGWWVLSGWLLLATALVVVAIVRRRQRNRYRHEALTLLDAIASRPDVPPAESARQVAEVLKRAALVAYPRARGCESLR